VLVICFLESRKPLLKTLCSSPESCEILIRAAFKLVEITQIAMYVVDIREMRLKFKEAD